MLKTCYTLIFLIKQSQQNKNMIIEIHLNILPDRVLLCAWEIPNSSWQDNKEKIFSFISKTIRTYNGHYNRNKWQEHFVYTLNGKPHLFFDVQNRLNEYLPQLKAIEIVN